VGEEEKDVSELLPAWGQDTAAAVTRMAAPAIQHSEHGTRQQPPPPQQQQQQQAGAGGSSSAAAGGDDTSVLAPGGSIELRNVYFEAVPLGLVSALVTDKGVMDKAQVAALMQSRGKGYEQAFGLSLPEDMLAV
jgi:translation initiation factor 2B subunit (eIF-2B alpha/beta/delta family)